MGLQTPLFAEHQRLGARIVPFAGWDMPLHYGSQLDEHRAVRAAAGLFDVSHMRPIDVAGPGARALLRRLLANDVGTLVTPGAALYSCMLNEQGGIIDDLIAYYRGPERYRLVVNAATAAKDWAWLRQQATDQDVSLRLRDDLALIAVQGPEARAKTVPLLPAALQAPALALPRFAAVEEGEWFVSRTGYTGEDGFELIVPGEHAPEPWRALLDAGVRPCGLGARDTLRLEAGLNLYGQDMDDTVSPLESGLGWTVAWEPAERDFVGREALERQRAAGGLRAFVGMILVERGVLRARQSVLADGQACGEITSGGFAPTLQRAIGLARVVAGMPERCTVEIRGQTVAARVVKPPFVRQGRARIG